MTHILTIHYRLIVSIPFKIFLDLLLSIKILLLFQIYLVAAVDGTELFKGEQLSTATFTDVDLYFGDKNADAADAQIRNFKIRPKYNL